MQKEKPSQEQKERPKTAKPARGKKDTNLNQKEEEFKSHENKKK